MTDCIFCKIIKGEIPSYKIYEDENTYAFLDNSCDAFGHTLVVPKTHTENIFSTSIKEYSAVMQTVQKIASHYKSLGYTGVNILNNNGASAEQSVFHLHVHVIPRKEGDNIQIYPDLKKQELNLSEIQSKLKLF